jgi:hypothetical protein
VGTDVIVGAPREESLQSLSGTASAVWDLLECPRSYPNLVGTLSHAYSVQADVIASDIKSLLDDLLHLHLIEGVVETDD